MEYKFTLLVLGLFIKLLLAKDNDVNTNIIRDLLLSQKGDLTKSISSEDASRLKNSLMNNKELKVLLKQNGLGSLANDETIEQLFDQFAPSEGNIKNETSVGLNNAAIADILGDKIGTNLQSLLGHASFNNRCKKDVLYIVQHYREKWVVRMLDSFGKPASGILAGATSFYGSYWQCVNTMSPERGPDIPGFKGKSCWLIWAAKDMEFVKFVTSMICVPNSCDSQDIVDLHPIFKVILEEQVPILSESRYGLQFLVANCHTKPDPVTGAGYFFRFLVLSILAIILTCTIIDRFYLSGKYDVAALPSSHNGLTGNSTLDEKNATLLKLNGDSHRWGRWILCFSAYQNTLTLLNVDTVAQETACFHGIRFLCLSWVMMGHVSMHALPTVVNLEYMTSEFGKLPGIFIQQGFYAVDTFFVISGFFLTYLFMKNDTTKIKGKSWFLFYFHRYIRLTPAYVIVRLWAQTHWPGLSDGPIWMTVNNLISNCANSWPQSLLYLGNFGDVASKCLSWTWYLSNDFQFFCISPPFLICLKKYPRPTLIVMSIIVTSSCFLTSYISYSHGFYMMPKYVKDYVHNSIEASKNLGELTDVMYEKPYCRIGPYFVGMLLGYYYYASMNKRVLITKANQVFLWIVSISSMVMIIFGVYDQEFTIELATVYHGFGRVGWALAISWPIYACLKGYGVLNSALSWKLLYPISRLSYCVYLLHPIIMYSYYYSQEKPLTASYSTLTGIWIAVAFSSVVLAFAFSLAFETPFIKLEKQIRSS